MHEQEECLVWVIRCKHGQFIRKWATDADGLCMSFNDAQLFERRDGAEEWLWSFKETLELMPFDQSWFVEGWALEIENA